MTQSTPKNKIPNIPIHLGLILDGNRRWAVDKGMSTLEGHKKGYENLKTIGLEALGLGVKYVSAYVFSTENWNRSAEEVDYLMKLLKWVATHEAKQINKHNVRIRFAGSRDRLSDSIIKAIESAEELTANNTAGTLVLCLNYGGHQEIVDAVNKLIDNGEKQVTAQKLSSTMYASDIPPVDLIIRTSGEKRLSGFMLWRSVYSELYFTDKMWPDFSIQDLDEALLDYSGRKRRFGGN